MQCKGYSDVRLRTLGLAVPVDQTHIGASGDALVEFTDRKFESAILEVKVMYSSITY